MIETTKRRVLSGEQVRVHNQPVRVGGPATGSAACDAGAANVREIRDASGNIAEIHVQCECGSVTVLYCDYAG